MTRSERKDQQIQWLSELYHTFKFVALAIIVDSVTVSEDAVSNAVEQMLREISAGKCRAITLGQFSAWSRKIVRGCSKRTYKTHSGDVRIDHGAKNAAWVMRPDRRRTSIPKDPLDPDFDPYVRGETVGPSEKDEY